MATATLSATRGGQQGGITLTSGSYSLLDAGTDLGGYNPKWTLAQRRDGVGRAAARSLDPRQITLAVKIDAGSKDATAAAAELLAAEAEACARSGGTLRWQSASSTYPVNFRVQAAAAPPTQDWLWEARSIARVPIVLMCDPYAYGDAMSFLDRFATDSTSDYTQDKASGVFAYSSGGLACTTTGSGRTDWRHTTRGHVYTDAQVTLDVTLGATITNGFWDAVIRKPTDGTDTYLAARISQSADALQVIKRVAGAASTLGSDTSLTVAASTRYWVRIRCEGAKVTAEAFVAEPTPLATPAATVMVTLSPADQATFVKGHCGFSITPASTSERVNSFRVQSYVYRGAQPDVVRLRGIPGQIPAEATIDVSVPQAGSASAWGQVFYGEAQDYFNEVWNGEARSDTTGWGVSTGPSGMTHGTPASFTRITSDAKHVTPFYGTAAFQLVHGTVAQSGVDFPIYRRFNQGRNYIAVAWTKQAAGTVTQRLSLGGTVSDAGTISYTPGNAWDLRSVLWQPSADRNYAALVACAHTQGTAGTVALDGVGVFEAPLTTLGTAVTNAGTQGTVTSIPADGWPATPFYAMLDPGVATNELVRVTAASGTVVTWERGADSPTAAGTAQAHSTGGTVAILAAYEPGLSGAHGSMVDIIPLAGAASYSGMTGGSADANTRSGFKAILGSGTVSGTASILLDPASGVPGFFSGDEMLLEVWARANIGGGAQAPTMAAYVWNEASLGAKRYEIENQSTGYTITPPTSTAWRFLRIGVISIRYDDIANVRRAILALLPQVAVSTTFDLDYLIIHPWGLRAGSPTGQENDSSWPAFIDNAAGAAVRRMNAADLGGGQGVTLDAFYPVGGIVGDVPIALPGPNVDAVYRVSNLIPNDTTSLVSSDLYAATVEVAFNIVPRYLSVR